MKIKLLFGILGLVVTGLIVWGEISLVKHAINLAPDSGQYSGLIRLAVGIVTIWMSVGIAFILAALSLIFSLWCFLNGEK